MESKHQNSTKQHVLAAIREKRVAMRSKLSFTAEGVLAGLVALLVLVVSVALVSFTFFSVRVGGHEALLGFGPRGVGTFLLVFPWPLLALDILLVLFLEMLLRRFKFGYRSPVLYLLLGLVVIAGAAGLFLDRGTSVNDDLLDQADHAGLPAPFGEVYEHLHAPAPHERGIFRGIVGAVASSSFELMPDDFDHDPENGAFTVILPPQFPASTLSPGERAYIAGDLEGSTTIRAFGVRISPR